jgi:hypothetical protein
MNDAADEPDDEREYPGSAIRPRAGAKISDQELGRGRVARPFGFALTDPGVRLSRTRLLPRVTRNGRHRPPKDG